MYRQNKRGMALRITHVNYMLLVVLEGILLFNASKSQENG